MKIAINYPNFCLRAEFDFLPGSCVGFYGPSGSGKSSILRAAAGLIDGANKPLKREQLGFLHQDYSLFEHLNIEQNLLTCKRKNFRDEMRAFFAKEKIDEYLANLLKTAGIYELKNAYPAELSGGQRQRAALCCALANKPKFLLLDEPFSALDDEAKNALIALLQGFMKEFSLNVALISHSAFELANLAEKIYILKEGQIVKSMENSEFKEEFLKKYQDFF